MLIVSTSYLTSAYFFHCSFLFHYMQSLTVPPTPLHHWPTLCRKWRANFNKVGSAVLEVVDLASNIHTKRKHDLTSSFPESHKCEVHHVTSAPKFVTFDGIAMRHPRSAKNSEETYRWQSIGWENIVMHAFGKAKGSAAYNQTANTSLISIINMASYQVIPSVRPFLINEESLVEIEVNIRISQAAPFLNQVAFLNRIV